METGTAAPKRRLPKAQPPAAAPEAPAPPRKAQSWDDWMGTKPPVPPGKPGGGSARPPGGRNRFDVDVNFEETLNPAERIQGKADALATKAGDPTDFYYKRSGVTAAAAETENALAKVGRHYEEQLGGKDLLEDLEQQLEQDPQSGRIASKLARGEALAPSEKTIYDKNPQAWDQTAERANELFEHVREHDQPIRAEADRLEKAGDRAGADDLRASLWAQGDLGQGYFPWGEVSLGDIIREVGAGRQTVGSIVEGLRKGNFDFQRLATKEPLSNSVTRIRKYARDLAAKRTQNHLLKELSGLEKQVRADSPTTADALKAFADQNVLNSKSWLDSTLAKARLEKINKEPVKVGDTFEATGVRGGPKGKVEVAQGSGESFRVKVNGAELPGDYSRHDVLAMKYADTLLDSSPASRAIGWWNSVASTMLVWGKASSALAAGIGNTARVGSRFLADGRAGVKALGEGGRWYMEYLKSRLPGGEASPELKAKIVEWEDVIGLDDASMEAITGVERGYELGGKLLERARSAGYAGVREPDIAARIVAYEAAKPGIREANPTWSPDRVRTHAKLEAAAVSDMAQGSTRSPLSYEPLYKMLMLFSRSALRESQQIVRQATSGRQGLKQLALNTGIRAAAWTAVLKLAAGQVDPDKLKGLLLRVTPQSWLFEDRAPAFAAPVAQAIQTGKALKVAATGSDWRGKRLGFKQRKTSYKSGNPIKAFNQRLDGHSLVSSIPEK